MKNYFKSNSSWKRDVSLYISSQLTSLFGSSIVDYAIIWHITLQTKSSVIMAIGTICVYLPRIIVSFFSGTWADRYNKKKIIMYADLGIVFITLLFACFLFLNYEYLWLIFIVLSLRSVATGIQTPARNSMIPLLAPKDTYIRINGIYNSFQSLITILSPAISGVLLSVFPLKIVILIDIITSMTAILILSQIVIVNKTTLVDKSSYLKNIAISWNYIKGNYIIRNLLKIYSIYFFLIVPISLLTPIKIARVFGDQVWRLSASQMCLSVGSVLGGFIIAKYGSLKLGFKIIGGSFSVIGLFSFALSLSNFNFFVLAIFVIGFFIALSNSSTVSMLQTNAEEKYQGRVFGIVQILTIGTNLIGMVVFGILGDVLNINILFAFTATLFIGLGIYIYLFIKSPIHE